MTAHDFDPDHEGCRNCAALPGEEEVCEGAPEKWGRWAIGWRGGLVDDRMETAGWAWLRLHEVVWRGPVRRIVARCKLRV